MSEVLGCAGLHDTTTHKGHTAPTNVQMLILRTEKQTKLNLVQGVGDKSSIEVDFQFQHKNC